MDCSLPGSSVNGISQTGILEWVAISFSRGSPALTGGIFFFFSKPLSYLGSPKRQCCAVLSHSVVSDSL